MFPIYFLHEYVSSLTSGHCPIVFFLDFSFHQFGSTCSSIRQILTVKFSLLLSQDSKTAEDPSPNFPSPRCAVFIQKFSAFHLHRFAWKLIKITSSIFTLIAISRYRTQNYLLITNSLPRSLQSPLFRPNSSIWWWTGVVKCNKDSPVGWLSRNYLTHAGSSVIEDTQRVMHTDAEVTIQKGKDRTRNTGRCRTSWMCWWLVGVSRSNVSRATHTVWVECAPRRRVARSATVVLVVLANGLYRRRARDWDPGFRMRARSQESSTQALRTRRLSLPDAPTRLVSLRLPYSPAACRCSPAPAYLPGGWCRSNLPLTVSPLPAWLPAYLLRIWPCPLSLFVPRCISKKTCVL